DRGLIKAHRPVVQTTEPHHPKMNAFVVAAPNVMVALDPTAPALVSHVGLDVAAILDGLSHPALRVGRRLALPRVVHIDASADASTPDFPDVSRGRYRIVMPRIEMVEVTVLTVDPALERTSDVSGLQNLKCLGRGIAPVPVVLVERAPDSARVD